MRGVRYQQFKSETDLLRPVVEWLRGDGARVFPDVALRGEDHCPDIVATTASGLWIFEGKLHFGLDVIAQADYWRNRCHIPWVVVPSVYRTDAFRLGEAICRERRIGIVTVGAAPRVYFKPAPAINPAIIDLEHLTERHESYAEAGTSRGGRLTPYRDTIDQLVSAVTAEPGLPTKHYVARINHHYRGGDSAATQTLNQWIRKGSVPGIRAVYDGRRYRLEPAEAEGNG